MRTRCPVVNQTSESDEAYVAPATATERKIADIWQDILDAGQISLHGNFFELGGHSLLLVQMHERLHEEFDKTVTLVELFKYPTVASLAQFLDGGSEVAASAAAQGRQQAMRRLKRQSLTEQETDIAVIGMSQPAGGRKRYLFGRRRVGQGAATGGAPLSGRHDRLA